jgi:cytochrome P450
LQAHQSLNSDVNHYIKDLGAKLSRVMIDLAKGKIPNKVTVFHEMIQSDLPESEKYLRRLRDEAQTLVGAGLTTTAWSLTNASFYLLDNPTVLEKLRKELWEAIPDLSAPDAFAHQKLENLPYLRGCIREGIRLSHGVTGRNPRIWDTPLRFNEWTIPPGIPVSMTVTDVHFNEELYPKPKEFIPERWLNNPKAPDGSSMERYFVAFGKGPRQCLGIKYVSF